MQMAPLLFSRYKGLVSVPKDDLTSAETSTKPTKDAVHPIKVKPKPADSVVIKAGDAKCSAGEQDSHLWTYKPRADVVDGKWHDGRKDL